MTTAQDLTPGQMIHLSYDPQYADDTEIDVLVETVDEGSFDVVTLDLPLKSWTVFDSELVQGLVVVS